LFFFFYSSRKQINHVLLQLPFWVLLKVCASIFHALSSVQLMQEEGWVVCRVFKKKITAMRKVSEHESPCWYDDQVSFMPEMDSPKHSSHSNLVYQQLPYHCKKELDLPYHLPREHFLQLPLLESPKMLQSAANVSSYGIDINHAAATTLHSSSLSHQIQQPHEHSFHAMDQMTTDWRVLDKFVASQLSPDGAANMFHASGNTNTNVLVSRHLEKQEMLPENASMSSSSNCHIEFWK
jgi:hypothetical protein